MAIVVVLLAAFLLLLIFSPGKTEPYRGADGKVLAGSVSEIVRMDIGGVEQGMILKGKSVDNPVLLFLHGGPGSPEYAIDHNRIPAGFDELFTICWWDQRGAGMSYNSRIPLETMTLEQFVEDTAEVARYLMERFGQEKVYLMGHSWGTYLGAHAAQKHPELFHAYIGIGQISDQFQSEKLAYDYMLEQSRLRGDTALVKKLEKFTLTGPESVTFDYLNGPRMEGMNKLGIGMFHEFRSMLSDIVLPLLTCREYTMGQKVGYLRGLLLSNKTMWGIVTEPPSLVEAIPSLTIPVYILHGAYDYQVSYTEALKYYEALEAPLKKFYTFENSAHSPIFEEPARFVQILQEDILGEK